MSDNNVGCSCQSRTSIQLDDLVKKITNTVSDPSDAKNGLQGDGDGIQLPCCL